MKLNIKSGCFLLAGLFLWILFSSCKKSDTKSFEAMDTVMRISVNGKKSEEAVNGAEKKVMELEKVFSVTDSGSQIYAINHRNDDSIILSNDVLSVLNVSLKVADMTKGAFNPFMYPVTSAWGFTNGNYRIPENDEIKDLLKLTDYRSAVINGNVLALKKGMMLDFGAVAKGYAGDRICDFLREKGISSALIDFGGNVQAVGNKVDGTSWNVGIRCPWNEESGGTDSVVAAIKICDEAVITSGGYFRFFTGDDGKKYIHIFDGNTGRPAESDLLSATIICKSGTYGDALSTACFILGKDKAVDLWRFWNQQNGNIYFDMILIDKNKSIYYTSDLLGKLQLLEDFQNIEVIE